MKILVVGSGGREHALAWKLARDKPDLELIAAPGNAGIAELARCVPVQPTGVKALADLAAAQQVDLTIVGPESALAAGVVDEFRARRLPIFGPTAAAARLESSKAFAKSVMREAGVPTGRAVTVRDAAAAKKAVRDFGAPVVIKASGLAAGKGVTVARSLDEANAAIDNLLQARALGAAGDEVLVEEFLDGEELSLFVLTDGTAAIPMLPAQDHKRLGDKDTGPNTGGMGAYAPVSIGTRSIVEGVLRDVVEPTLGWMREHAIPFTGLLYVGLMLTRNGPKVVEFNARFGDPETQAVLPLLESSLYEPLHAIASGGSVAGTRLDWARAYAVTTVVAAAGYPAKPRTGDVLTIPDVPGGVQVFHAGTARDSAGRLVSAGGRVLSVTALAEDIRRAAGLSRITAESVDLEGKQLRRDIAWREIAASGGRDLTPTRPSKVRWP